MNSERHKKSSQQALVQQSMSFFVDSGLNDKNSSLAAAEATFAYHCVQHNSSFRIMDCTTKIMKKIYNPAFSCARTKSEAIVEGVIAKHVINNIKTDFEKANFVSLFSDASNHRHVKLIPILVRFFSPESGVNVKLLDFQDKPGETAELLFSYIMENVNTYQLKEKIVAFCADNANTNFGGCARNGTNNIYKKLKDELSKNIIGIGCSAHVLNNTIQTAGDQLPIDIESILTKIYSHFHVFTVRVETLKDYCNYVNAEYQHVLGYSKTRWLSLLPALTRLRDMFSPLKAYFLSQPNCPTVLKSFFNDPFEELWLCFIQKQALLFHSAVLEVEGQNTSVVQVSVVLTRLLHKL